MKRKPINDKPPYIYSFRPILFWYKCRKCNQEFRRENGWKILDSKFNNHGSLTQTYMCNDCASSREDVIACMDEQNKKPPMPKCFGVRN